MVRFELGVEDLASTRFGISPLTETVCSLVAVSDPSYHALHLPWVRSARRCLDRLDAPLLLSLVGPTRGLGRFVSGPSRAIPDYLTPRPTRFAPRFADEMAIVRATPPGIVRRDLIATHAPDPVPDPLAAAMRRGSPPGGSAARPHLRRARALPRAGSGAELAGHAARARGRHDLPGTPPRHRGRPPAVRRHAPEPAVARRSAVRRRDDQRPHGGRRRTRASVDAVDLRDQAGAPDGRRRAALAAVPEPRDRNALESAPARAEL